MNRTEFILTLLLACWVIFHAFVVVCLHFSKITFLKKSFRKTVRVSNGLDPDQDRRSVGLFLDPNCLQKLSVDDKSRRYQGKSLAYPTSKVILTIILTVFIVVKMLSAFYVCCK